MIQKSSLVCDECLHMEQTIVKQFTERALLDIINTRGPYNGRRDPLSERAREKIICYDVSKHLCYGLCISRSLIREQYKWRRMGLVNALQSSS